MDFVNKWIFRAAAKIGLADGSGLIRRRLGVSASKAKGMTHAGAAEIQMYLNGLGGDGEGATSTRDRFASLKYGNDRTSNADKDEIRARLIQNLGIPREEADNYLAAALAGYASDYENDLEDEYPQTDGERLFGDAETKYGSGSPYEMAMEKARRAATMSR